MTVPSAQLLPRERVYNQAYLAASGNIFPSGIVPVTEASTMQVTVTVDAAVDLIAVIGSANQEGIIASLAAGQMATITFGVRSQDPVNFKFDGDCTIRHLYVDETTQGEGR